MCEYAKQFLVYIHQYYKYYLINYLVRYFSFSSGSDDDNHITLHPVSGIAAQHEFINAGYVDVSTYERIFYVLLLWLTVVKQGKFL